MGRDHLTRADAIQVARIEAALPALATARELTDRFTDMVRNVREHALVFRRKHNLQVFQTDITDSLVDI